MSYSDTLLNYINSSNFILGNIKKGKIRSEELYQYNQTEYLFMLKALTLGQLDSFSTINAILESPNAYDIIFKSKTATLFFFTNSFIQDEIVSLNILDNLNGSVQEYLLDDDSFINKCLNSSTFITSTLGKNTISLSEKWLYYLCKNEFASNEWMNNYGVSTYFENINNTLLNSSDKYFNKYESVDNTYNTQYITRGYYVYSNTEGTFTDSGSETVGQKHTLSVPNNSIVLTYKIRSGHTNYKNHIGSSQNKKDYFQTSGSGTYTSEGAFIRGVSVYCLYSDGRSEETNLMLDYRAFVAK